MLFAPRVILCKAARTKKGGTVLPSQLPAQVEQWHKSHRYVDLWTFHPAICYIIAYMALPSQICKSVDMQHTSSILELPQI